MTSREPAGDLRSAVRLGLVIDSHKYSVSHCPRRMGTNAPGEGEGTPVRSTRLHRRQLREQASRRHRTDRAARYWTEGAEYRRIRPRPRPERRRLLSSCMIHGVSADDASNRREERSCFSSDCSWTAVGHWERDRHARCESCRTRLRRRRVGLVLTLRAGVQQAMRPDAARCARLHGSAKRICDGA